MSTRADEQLAEEARQGSVEAAEELFRRFWPSAWRVALAITRRRDLAEDAAQDAFQKAFGALHTFDNRRRFLPWLHGIVVNAALDHVRRERRFTSLGRSSEASPDWTVDVHSDEELFRALATLPPETRALIALRYWLDLSPADIAEVMDTPIGTVSSRLSRALSRLRDELEVHRVH